MECSRRSSPTVVFECGLIANESELVRRYRISNPAFPHQTTLDQSFDQEKFEAYQQLGVHAAKCSAKIRLGLV